MNTKKMAVGMLILWVILFILALSACQPNQIDPIPVETEFVGSWWEKHYNPGEYKTMYIRDKDTLELCLYESYQKISFEKMKYEFQSSKLTVHGIFELPFKGVVKVDSMDFQGELFLKVK